MMQHALRSSLPGRAQAPARPTRLGAPLASPAARRCVRHTMAVSAAVSAATETVLNPAQAAQVARLTQEVLEAEARLAALFEPGKPMPRAGAVAKLRREVAEVKAALAEAMGSSDGQLPQEMGEQAAARARNAFLEVERSLALKQNSSIREAEAMEMATLEAENERLRVEAKALLYRLGRLEELAEQHMASGTPQRLAQQPQQAQQAQVPQQPQPPARPSIPQPSGGRSGADVSSLNASLATQQATQMTVSDLQREIEDLAARSDKPYKSWRDMF